MKAEVKVNKISRTWEDIIVYAEQNTDKTFHLLFPTGIFEFADGSTVSFVASGENIVRLCAKNEEMNFQVDYNYEENKCVPSMSNLPSAFQGAAYATANVFRGAMLMRLYETRTVEAKEFKNDLLPKGSAEERTSAPVSSWIPSKTNPSGRKINWKRPSHQVQVAGYLMYKGTPKERFVPGYTRYKDLPPKGEPTIKKFFL